MDIRIAFEGSSGTLALRSAVIPTALTNDSLGNSVVARAPVQTSRASGTVGVRGYD